MIYLTHAVAVLRFRIAAEPNAPAPTIPQLIGYVILGGAFYGALMATYGGLDGDRPWQVLYTAIKVPLLILGTFALTLPCFFVINTLAGLRDDFGAAVYGLVSTQAGLSIVLASLAPYTMLVYVSSDHYHAASSFNALMFTIASLAGQVILRRHYGSLIARNPRHRLMVKLWLFLYAFVGIQMCWVLRPFLGWTDVPVTFFREQAWGNAYVILFQKYLRLFF
jgi:hypothetical protein